MAGENGRQPISNTVIITLIVTIGLAVLAAFWQLSDPRADIKTLRDDLRANYLTIREHEEFVQRFNSDIARVERENTNQISRDEVHNVWQQRRSEIDAMHRQIDDFKHGHITRSEFEALWANHIREIEKLDKEVATLQLQLNNHEHEDRALDHKR